MEEVSYLNHVKLKTSHDILISGLFMFYKDCVILLLRQLYTRTEVLVL